MRIGLIAPPWVPVPPVTYGGTELVVDTLARGLTDLGHDVRLFTIGSSTCPVTRDHLFDTARKPMGTSIDEAAHVLAAYDALTDVDIVHDHTVIGPLLAAARGDVRAPIVTTHHGTFSPECLRIFRETAEHAHLVCISHAQARSAGAIRTAAVIHHGIDLDRHTAGDGSGGYALFLGRMSADKGVHQAVRIARAAGVPLVIIAKMREPAEAEYFHEQVEPLLTSSDVVIYEPPPEQRLRLLREAVALLNPITWPEPFGLVMIEALAAGTPVLVFPNGAAPEIVDDGVTGYLCSDEHEMVDALRRVGEISRPACRRAAESRFSMSRLAEDHERLYHHILFRPRRTPARRSAIGGHARHRSIEPPREWVEVGE